MDFFTTLSLIVAGLIFLLTLLAQILYDNYSIESTDGKTDKEKKAYGISFSKKFTLFYAYL